jgi:hypothetical protein
MNTTYKVLIGVGVSISALVVIGIIAFMIYYFWPSSSSSGRLSTPTGEMTVITGPYHSYNGISGVLSTGHIYQSRYPEKDIFSRYGYRAVYTKSGEVVDRNKSSAIKWNDLVYKVMTYEDDEREDSGFQFKIPRQKAGLIASNIEYELVATVYDNPDGEGTPLYKELILGRVDSETSGELIVTETDDMEDNKLLIS